MALLCPQIYDWSATRACKLPASIGYRCTPLTVSVQHQSVGSTLVRAHSSVNSRLIITETIKVKKYAGRLQSNHPAFILPKNDLMHAHMELALPVSDQDGSDNVEGGDRLVLRCICCPVLVAGVRHELTDCRRFALA
jgi:hypothetical protein